MHLQSLPISHLKINYNITPRISQESRQSLPQTNIIIINSPQDRQPDPPQHPHIFSSSFHTTRILNLTPQQMHRFISSQKSHVDVLYLEVALGTAEREWCQISVSVLAMNEVVDCSSHWHRTVYSSAQLSSANSHRPHLLRTATPISIAVSNGQFTLS